MGRHWMEAVLHGALYNGIEVTLIALIGIIHLVGWEVWAPVLWLSFAAAALWTILASTRDAQEEAQDLVEGEAIYITDFIGGALLMLVLSALTVRYGVGYGIIFVVAAIQNLRYSAMAYDWKENYDRHERERDNMP